MSPSKFRGNLFVPAGEVEWAKLLDYPPRFMQEGRIHGSSSSFTRQQREGLRYEKRALDYLQELVAWRAEKDFLLLPSRWIMFKTVGNNNQIRFCQPDGILVNSEAKKLILIEIKLQHTNTAWRQIRLLYEPVLRVVFPNYSIASIELCKWLDPHTSFGEQYSYAEDIFKATESGLGIHLFKPGREKKQSKARRG